MTQIIFRHIVMVVSDITYRNISGSRVYHVDRECYVLYMGKPNYMHRPFLRIGNSSHLPALIRRYIGSVVLSDRLTGNCFIEADSLDNASSQPTNYVGPDEIVEAITPFIGKKQLARRPLNTGNGKDREKGGRVVFYTDGNFRILLEGHRLFDLFEREKNDRHLINEIQRLEDCVTTTEGAITPADLPGAGFIIFRQNTLALFQDGLLQSCNLNKNSLMSMAEAMVPPSMLRQFGGASDQDLLINLSKWHKVNAHSMAFIFDPAAKGVEQSFFSFIKKAGAKAERLTPPALPEYLAMSGNSQVPFLKLGKNPPTNDLAGSSIKEIALPQGASWVHAKPPLLTGVPYFFPAGKGKKKSQSADLLKHAQDSFEQFMEAAGREITVQLAQPSERQKALNSLIRNQEIEDSVKLSLLLWLWNHLGVEAAEGRAEAKNDGDLITEQLVNLQNTVALPIRANIFQQDTEVIIVFSMYEGRDKQAFRSQVVAREKIADLAHFEPDNNFFEEERRRLSETLQLILNPDKPASGEKSPTATQLTKEQIAADPVLFPGPETAGFGEEKGTGKKDRKKVSPLLLVGAVALVFVVALLLFLFIPRGANSSSTDSLASVEAPEIIIEQTKPQDTPESDDNSRKVFLPNIEWSLVEILFITNWIGYNNGYALVGEEAVLERNPDWIYPGNVFTLPDESRHTVVEGDAIWLIASNFLDQMFEIAGMTEEEFRVFIKTMGYNRVMQFKNN